MPHVPSSSGAKAKPVSLNRPPRLAKATQPLVVSSIHVTTPSADKGKAPTLSKSMAHPPFKLPIIADIPWPSRNEKGKRSSHVC